MSIRFLKSRAYQSAAFRAALRGRAQVVATSDTLPASSAALSNAHAPPPRKINAAHDDAQHPERPPGQPHHHLMISIRRLPVYIMGLPETQFIVVPARVPPRFELEPSAARRAGKSAAPTKIPRAGFKPSHAFKPDREQPFIGDGEEPFGADPLRRRPVRRRPRQELLPPLTALHHRARKKKRQRDGQRNGQSPAGAFFRSWVGGLRRSPIRGITERQILPAPDCRARTHRLLDKIFVARLSLPHRPGILRGVLGENRLGQ
jgi:hypothetical protein